MASAGPIDKQAATRLPELAEWVEEIAGLTKPDAVVWCDGSQAEWDRLTSLLVESGTFTRLNPELRPNSKAKVRSLVTRLPSVVKSVPWA